MINSYQYQYILDFNTCFMIDNLWVISLAQTDHFIRIKLSTDVVLIGVFTHQNEKE
jgi:energy-converting hydrogenase Eha subunit G